MWNVQFPALHQEGIDLALRAMRERENTYQEIAARQANSISGLGIWKLAISREQNNQWPQRSEFCSYDHNHHCQWHCQKCADTTPNSTPE